MADKWLVYSREHNAWWRPEAAGYTMDMAQAGRYTEQEAEAHCDDAATGRGRHGDDGVPEFMTPDGESFRECQALNAELVAALKQAREELQHCTHELWGEDFNNPGMNALIEKAESQ